METEIDLNESEIDLNESGHFLKANWDRSKRVWTISQSELRSIWDPSKGPIKIWINLVLGS